MLVLGCYFSLGYAVLFGFGEEYHFHIKLIGLEKIYIQVLDQISRKVGTKGVPNSGFS